MDTMSTRQLTLLESIVVAGRIAVAELAGIAHVSTVTIRKDLDDLEARGLIRRERGVAMLVSPDDPQGVSPTTTRRRSASPQPRPRP